MNIILKTADFSGENIGRVMVDNEYYRSAVSNYSNLNAVTSQALLEFTTNLISSGIINKLSYIHLPKIGNTVNEALFNLVDKAKSMVIGENYLSLTNGFLHKNTVSYSTLINFINPIKLTDFSYVCVPNNKRVTGNVSQTTGMHRMFLGGTVYEMMSRDSKISTYVDPQINPSVVNPALIDVMGVSCNTSKSEFFTKTATNNIAINSWAPIGSANQTSINSYSLGSRYEVDGATLTDTEIQNLFILGSSLSQSELDLLVLESYKLAVAIGTLIV